MSIRATIKALVRAGDLTPYLPKSRNPPRRRLYMTRKAGDDLLNPRSASNLLSGRAPIQAALEHWTRGDRVFGSKRGGGFLKRLEPPPDEIWEIRVTNPVVQSRLFGRFAEPDTLILCSFYTRNFLGKRNSKNWQIAMKECERLWDDLFGKTRPFCGFYISDYVTENCDDFPI